MLSGYTVKPEERDVLRKWLISLQNPQHPRICVSSWQQGWGGLQRHTSLLEQPLCVAGQVFERGLGTHADSEIVLQATEPIGRFRAFVGLDRNRNSVRSTAQIQFSVWAENSCLWESPFMTILDAPLAVDVDLNGATLFTLKAQAKETLHLAHADWVNLEAITTNGEVALFEEKLSPTLPISFIYNGQPSEFWFPKWNFKQTLTSGSEFEEHNFSYSDPDTGLVCSVTLKAYHDSPTYLWNVDFRNDGKFSTPLLESVKTLDLRWLPIGKSTIQRARGSSHYEGEPTNDPEVFRDDFKIYTEIIRNREMIFGAIGGRPSVDWMPYFNVISDTEGLTFGIGWTGQWQSRIFQDSEGVHIQAGMQSVRLRLEPGESIRQPSVLMTYWRSENPIRGNNLLRRFINDHLLPRNADEVIQPPASNLTWGGMVERSHLERVANLDKEKIPFDCYWIDAGWYGKAGPNEDEFSQEWGSQAGDWSINKDTFPHGFRKISDRAHQQGLKFLLWVEPERAIYGTPVTLMHPEWFFGDKRAGEPLLLNLGNHEACSWCTELVAGLIAEQGLDCYRHDFNTSPLPLWQAQDSPDRIGITEIRYVEGLYGFFDELRRRFPTLLIDNCASGGRRLDFEMMRRSIPLWASDMQCCPDYLPERNLQHLSGLSHWLPRFGIGTQNHPGDTYHFRTALAAAIAVHLFSYERDALTQDYPYEWLRRRLNEYHKAKRYFSGDFYPLLNVTDSFRDWSATQFYRPDLDSGILLVFRKSESSIVKASLELFGLIPEANYRFEDADSGTLLELSGDDLIKKGFSVEISNKRESRLFFYSLIR